MQGIVVFLPDKKGIHSVYLMKLKARGEIDWNDDGFALAHTTTRDCAINYATKLASRLGLSVLEIRET